MKVDEVRQALSPEEILSGEFGLEREGLRVDINGHLAMTPHPQIFGDKMENPYITTDFSESQVEVVTPVYDSVERAHAVLECLVDIVNHEIGPDEYLWPASMPAITPDDDQIPIAHYSNLGKDYEEYRKMLIQKYGGKKQLLTGVHFNFSLPKNVIEKLRKLFRPDWTLRYFQDQIYLHIAKVFLKYRWLLIYLTGSSSCCHDSYDQISSYNMKPVKDHSLVSYEGPSFRNSKSGYKNIVDLFPSWDSVESYVEDVRSFIERGDIVGAKELYTQVRLKTSSKDRVLEELIDEGIHYIEIRLLDLNVFDKTGVNLDDLKFLHLFLVYCLFSEPEFSDDWQKIALENELNISSQGLREDAFVLTEKGQVPFKQAANEILDDISDMNQKLGLGKEELIEMMRYKVNHPSRTHAYAQSSLSEKDGYIKAMMNFAEAYKMDTENFVYQARGFENYELSTQILIKEALTRGIKLTELDPSDNFLMLSKNEKKALVKQSTKTDLDNYASVLAMENKVVTKKILEKEGIAVPKGEEYHNLKQVRAGISAFENIPVVVKPKSTNFGTGIFIFDQGADEKELIKACEEAFKFDDTVLVESYIPGEEYRFLVIGGKLAAVLNRVAANVVGDGVHTIRELVELKNEDALRGEHYERPLEKIYLDVQSLTYLKDHGYDPDEIPAAGERVQLRGNSNISTGGDSIDMTDQMPEHYKRIAEQAAKAIGGAFVGVDMIIEDYKKEDSCFGIIELNFNPMMSMHAYPYKGKRRRTGAYTLSALGLIDEDFASIDQNTIQYEG